MNEKGQAQFRLERDSQGEMQIALGNYYGINTARLKNEWFLTGVTTNSSLLIAYLFIKQAYAQAHAKLGIIDNTVAQAIIQASEEMCAPTYADQFIAEALQSVCGTTLNTNINEVIANRAEEILGGIPGHYKLVQTEIVNLNQEPNSLFLVATKLAILLSLANVEPEILNLERLLRRDALTLAKVLKVSATPHNQSTTGQWGKRLNIFTAELEVAVKRIKESQSNLLFKEDSDNDNNISGENTNLQIIKLVLHNLSALTGYKFKEEDLMPADIGQSEFVISDLVLVSSALKDLATVLSKVANLTKMAHSGPAAQSDTAKKRETLVQIFADSLHMAAYQVIGNNFSLTFLAQCEQLESGTLMPLLSHTILSMADLLKAILIGFQRKGLL